MEKDRVRDYKIDVMRFVGTLLVIFAHVDPPLLIRNIRTFDVVMLVFISGMTYMYNRRETYLKYFIKRVKKLLIPTYLTITFIFLISYIVCSILNRPQLYSIITIVNSYLLTDNGIGYIWITKVYLLIALVSPLLSKIVRTIKNDLCFFVVSAFIYAIYYFCFIKIQNSGSSILRDYLSYLLPYSIIVMFGMRCVINSQFLNRLISFSSNLFVILLIFELARGNGFQPNSFKFPPLPYYLLYGLSVGSILYKILPNKENVIISWISKNSFKIYLIHIIMLLAINLFIDVMNARFLDNYIIKYVVVLVCSLFALQILNLIIERFQCMDIKNYKQNCSKE